MGPPLSIHDPIERDFGRIISFLYRKSLVHVKAAVARTVKSLGGKYFVKKFSAWRINNKRLKTAKCRKI
jgi:hypothetical protein